MLWLMGMMWVLYGHATFMLGVQANAGQARMDAVSSLFETQEHIPFLPTHSLTVIAQETTKLVAEQGRLATLSCETRCASLQAKRATLAARLDALSVEASEVRRWQAERDHQEQAAPREQARRDAARDDAVMATVATWVRIPVATLQWIMAVGLAVFLEGFASLCWVLALPQPEPHVPDPVTSEQLAVTDEAYDDNHMLLKEVPDVTVRNSSADSSYEVRLRCARQAVRSGQLKCTVRAVRHYLGCGSDAASAICKTLIREQEA
ncbi:hypothetical protein [Herbaspirillum sp. RV1423]|uniref:hypothetical protein n=1 Tax=Herbaspirillum sp. RV1423 TaxID=1443993 RepID=UPI0012DD5664|nr:hypothetical protein [Herbaspirillum sp. RV1423]